MAQFLGTPKVQYFDNNGDPLSGGLLYTYVAGTTTNKATYPTLADAAAGTNPNANPVILDARGEAAVVLSGVTKLVLKDSAGSTIWTVDSASAADSNLAVDDLTDVVITSLTDNEVLAYDTGTSKWINQTGIEAGLVTETGTQTLTNKTLTAPIISSIVNTGTLTLPTSTDTLVGRATTDTLTNKTLTAPVISTISNTGTITLPTGTRTLVARDTTDTLTNKTLTLPVISSISNTGTITLPTGTRTLVARDTTDTLTNKTLTAPIISSIVNTGTLTLPTSTDTLVGRATTDTLTNKTLTAPVIASIVNTGTLTLPTSTDTLVGKATTDIFTNKTFNANGTGNSLSNVDVADLANGTAGQLITWSAAGAPTTIAAGTATHILTSNGAGAAPTFQAASSLGAWVLIASATASASASIEFTGIAADTYNALQVRISRLQPATDATNLLMQIGTGAGPTYDTAGNQWAARTLNSAGTSAIRSSASDTSIEIAFNLSTIGNEFVDAVVEVLYPIIGTRAVRTTAIYTDSGSVQTDQVGWGSPGAEIGDTTALKFFMSSGNITTGYFNLYGLKNS